MGWPPWWWYNSSMKTAGEIMTRNVVAVEPETPLIEAVNILLKNGYNGLPVIAGGLLVGIITEYDMVTKGSAVHIPTLIKMLGGLDQKYAGELKEQLKGILAMKVGDVMNSEPLTLGEDADILKVVDTFSQHHKVNPIPILDKDNKLVGIISRSDMLKFLGDSRLTLNNTSEQEIEKNIDRFVNNFQNKFVLVRKSRTRLWLLASILFALAGFLIAWFMILRVNL
jgi:CBS domain-containing protein